MAANDKETAEQKLLKMIETSSEEEVSAPKKKRKLGRKQSSLSFLRTINRLLILGIFAAGFFLFQQIQEGSALMQQAVDYSQPAMPSGMRAGAPLTPTVQKLSYYTSPLERRNLFEPYEQKPKSVVEVTEKNRDIAEKTGHLRLVGIAWLDTLDSANALIEDTRKEVTYFLQKDDSLGDINIKTIYADSVELGFEDEEIMIRYDIPQN